MKVNNLISILLLITILISCVLSNQMVFTNNKSHPDSFVLNNDRLHYNQKLSSNLVALNVFIFDKFTEDPLIGAEVVVYNDSYSITYITDSNGQCIFNIAPGSYNLNISMIYYYNGTVLGLSVDSNIGNQLFGLVPLNGVGIISSTQILEGENYEAKLTYSTTGTVYDFSFYYDGGFIVTTTNTIISLGQLLKGVHNLTVIMNCSEGLFSDQITLYVLGINFIKPVNESVVQGGSILVEFEYIGMDPLNLFAWNFLTASVNGIKYVNTTRSEITSLILPVFQNGTNILEFTFDFYLGTLQYNLSVTATDVFPALDVSIGDYWIYSIKEISTQTMQGTQSICEIEVNDKLSPVEVNMSVSFTKYDIVTNILTEFTSGWFLVNTINGYIESRGGNLSLPIDTVFFIFTGLQYSYINASIYNTFDMAVGKVSLSSWNGVETWRSLPLVPFPSGITWIQHNMKSTGILLYTTYFMYGLQILELKLLDSTYLPLAPQLISNELTFEQGAKNQLLSWRVQGSGSYKIFQNDTIVKTGTWTLGELITYNLTSLVAGDYNVTALFYNSLGIFSLYESDIHVLPQSPPIIIRYPSINSTGDLMTNTIAWSVFDDSAGSYIIYNNGTQDRTGTWKSGDKIIYIFGVLAPGYYNFTIKIIDNTGQSTTDTFITVIPNPPLPIITTQYQTITTTVPGTTTQTSTETTTQTQTQTKTQTQTTISTIISSIISSTTKTSEGFSVVIMIFGFLSALLIRRKRKNI